MNATPAPLPNVKSVVPFFNVTNMDASLRFYTEGLGFTLKNKWVVDGKIRWCWLELGGAALMLQTFAPNHNASAQTKLGQGVSLWFQCEDAIALYHESRSRHLNPSEPQVGNHLWDTVIHDPDGYILHFESPTTVPEETKLSDITGS